VLVDRSADGVRVLSRRLGVPASPLLRQAGVYTVSNLLSRAFPFLLLPIMTRFLSPADYGIVAMFALTTTVLEPFISVGLAGALTVTYYDKSTDLAAYLGTGLIMVATIALPFLALLLLLGDQISSVTSVPALWLVLVVPYIVARAVGSSLLALLRVREKAVLFSLFQNLQTVGAIVLALVLVIALQLAWRGRVAADLVIAGAFAVGSLVWLRRSGWLRFEYVRTYARQIATFGVPLIPHTLGAALILQTDRLFLTNLVGVDETGIYTVGYQLALVIELVAVSFNYAYAPWLFRRLTDGDDHVKRQLVRYTYVQFAGMAVLAATVAIVMPWLAGMLLDRSFAGSGEFVGWFALGFFFSGLYYMVTNYIFYAQRTRWLAAVTITVAAINVPLTYGLIKLNGAVGAAQAMSISLGLSFLFTWIVSQRVYPMPWFGRFSRSSEGPS
jgi:O-antigen/teichoic acid export membrane protein